MIAVEREPENDLIWLRNQARYWRVQHERAVKREERFKQESRQLRKTVRQQKSELKEQKGQIEAMQGELVWLKEQLFGRKSEKSKARGKEGEEGGFWEEPCRDKEKGRRKRGQQPGAKGHGRRRHPELEFRIIEHELNAEERRCPKCGLLYEASAGYEQSEEIHWEVRVVRRIHRRLRYRRGCQCPSAPCVMTAPVVPKLIAKGKFSCGFWVELLMEKYLHQRPLARIRQALSIEGMRCPSQGTLTGGLERIGALVQPLYGAILERSRGASHWHMDETRWMVFVEVEGKEGHRWWLWVVVTSDTCVYIVDPSRSAKVPAEHLGEGAEGILSVDRFAAYKLLGEGIELAFCWAHVRRDYKRIREGHAKLRCWAEQWIERINQIYRLNRERLALRGHKQKFHSADQRLRAGLEEMAQIRDKELAREGLHAAQKKALKSLREHWPGLLIFVDNPDVPMDNNEAERRLRLPVVGRKNYYGSGALWSGMLSAMLFTLFQTLLLNQINPKAFLLAYFEACAANRGQPPENLESFLPWNLSAVEKSAWAYPAHPP